MRLKLWQIVLAVWLLLWGLLGVSNFRFEAQNLVLGFLAVAAGILILLDR